LSIYFGRCLVEVRLSRGVIGMQHKILRRDIHWPGVRWGRWMDW